MSAFTLRPYQAGLIAEVRATFRPDRRRTVLQSPTGSGKTLLTAHMIREAAQRGKSAWFVVHRRELLDQTSGALREAGVTHGRIEGGGRLTKDPVQVASIQTLVRRIGKLDPPDLIVVDEAHHAAARSYRTVLDACPNAYVVGLTATPVRTDGRGLDDLFDNIVPGPSVQWLTENGYLAPYRLVAPPNSIDLGAVHRRGGDYERGELEAAVDRTAILGDAADHYLRHVAAKANGRPPTCLVYCVSRRHAHHVTEAYRSAGIDARYCAGDTDKAERDAIVAGFRTGKPAVIVSVDLFGEGLDVPGLAAVQLLRPTQSLGLHLQQIGRSLRPEPGKEYAMVLDHVGNVWRHGLPDEERVWSLEGEGGRKAEAGEQGPGIRLCESCFVIYRVTLPACPVCGAAPAPSKRKDPEVVEGDLEEVDLEALRNSRRKEQGQAKGLEALVTLAKVRGNRAAWAGIVHSSRTGMDRAAAIREANRLWREL